MTVGVSKKMGNELVFTRVFDAPRELVFEAWTDPECVVKVGAEWIQDHHGRMEAEVGGHETLICLDEFLTGVTN